MLRAEHFRFRRLIYKASHNRLLTQILTSYQYYTKQLQYSETPHYDHMDDVLAEHFEMLNSLEKKDPERGAAVVRKHLKAQRNVQDMVDLINNLKIGKIMAEKKILSKRDQQGI